MTQAEANVLQSILNTSKNIGNDANIAQIAPTNAPTAPTSNSTTLSQLSVGSQPTVQSSTVEQQEHPIENNQQLPGQPALPNEVAQAYKELYESTKNELNSLKAMIAELKTANAKLAITATNGDSNVGNRSAESILADMFIDDVKSKKNVF